MRGAPAAAARVAEADFDGLLHSVTTPVEGLKETKLKKKLKKNKRNKTTSNGTKARRPRERREGEKKRRVVGGEQGSNGISVLVSNRNDSRYITTLNRQDDL